MFGKVATVLSLLWTGSYCLPASVNAQRGDLRPLVIWHGLGDSAHSKGMDEFMDMIREVHPGIYIHSVSLSDDDGEDRKAGWYGRMDDHMEVVYQQLNSVPELENGFDALGFSQGGQFLRAYVEQYNSPPMHNLITFGAQHMGISELPACRGWDVFCRFLHSYGKGRVYSEWAQENLVPAQYFRDTAQYSTYLERNHWLPKVNNEIASSRNTTYAKNFATLENLVLVVFSNDTTVIPKESGWFGSYIVIDDADVTTGEPLPILPMREQPLYLEDWIGLRTLDEGGKVRFATCDGPHMAVSRDCWEPLVLKYTGGVINNQEGRSHSLVIQST